MGVETNSSRVATVALLLVAAALIVTLAVVISNGNKKPSVVDETGPEAKLLELEKYVNKYDPTYSYRILPDYTSRGFSDATGRGYTVFLLNMTSQTWLSPSKVTHYTWWHFMSVVIPDEVAYEDVGALYMTGDDNDDAPRNPLTDPEFRLVIEMSLRTGIVCAQMRQMPNGPVKFFEDPEKKGRTSDDLIAYTFKYYMEGHRDEAEAVLLLPMVKSAVRGLDTISNFVDGRIQRFFVAGFSKPEKSFDRPRIQTGHRNVTADRNMRQMPNGPVKFFEDPEKKGRTSDDLIAYTFKYYMEGHRDEAEAVLLLPMVKSAVRGLDTISNFVDGRIQRFFVAGFSKRGWATWLTATVDKRIIGIAPIVLDFLNMQENFAHHYRPLNGWSWALKDYWYHNVTNYLFDPDNVFLTNVVDPISYRDKLLLPKYIITAGSDEFFLPDDAHYFYKDKLGPTYLRVHPNTDHPLIGRYRELLDELEGFFYMVLEDGQFPNLKWTRSEGSGTGTIAVTSDIEPMLITAWSADSFTNTRRDFRVIVASTPNTTETEFQPTIYREIGVGISGDEYRAIIQTPRTGWNCFFIEMKFPAPKNSYITFTTEVHIVPDTYPSDDCQDWECKGTLY